MKMKFTDRALAKLPPPPPGIKDYLRFDTVQAHMGARRSATALHLLFQARLADGSTFRKPLGKFPGYNTAMARKATRMLDGRLTAGEDLRAEEAGRKAKRDQARADAGYAFRDLIQDWEEAPTASKRRPRRPSYIKGTADGLRRAYEHLLDRPAASITPEQLEEVWESLADLPAAANAAAERVRILYRWGVKTKRLSVDPTQGVDLPEKPEERAHSPTGDEARKIWAAASTLGAPDGPAIKLLQVSVLRLREAIGALWSEFDDDYSKFSPSPERMKMGKPHIVWLAPIMQKMLAELPRFEGSDLVFSRDGRRPLTGFSGLKKRLDAALEGSGVRPFRFHDLRRSAVTWMAENGVSSIVADRLLGHASMKTISPTASTYNFAAERKAALELWANFLVGEEAESRSTPTLMLAAPGPEAVSESRTTIPALATVENSSHEEGAFETVGAKRSFIADFTAAAREARARERAERFAALMAKIAGDYDVARTNIEIHKSRLTPAFKAEFPRDSHSKAIEALLYRAAELALNRVTVVKRVELNRRIEEVSSRRAAAKKARAAEEAANAMGHEEYAREAAADAERLEMEASDWERIHQALSPLPDDPRVVEYRSSEASHKSSRALGVMQELKKRNKEIFGNEHGTWAARYAEAAVGWEGMSRDQGRRRSKTKE